MDWTPAAVRDRRWRASAPARLYALTGLAFVLIYKATRVVNLAIGEMLMIGAYVFFAFAAGLGLPVWAAIPLGARRPAACSARWSSAR